MPLLEAHFRGSFREGNKKPSLLTKSNQMKTLTIISFLLLAVIGYGQYHNPVLPNFDRMPPNREGIELLTVDHFTELWKEYKSECYNDSTLVNNHSRVTDSHCVIDYKCLIDSHWTKLWVHRVPTFEGFMNWLITKEEKQ